MKPPDPEKSPTLVREEVSPQTRPHDPILRRDEAGLKVMESSNPVEVHRQEQPPPDAAPPPQFMSPDPWRRLEKESPARNRAESGKSRIAAPGELLRNRGGFVEPVGHQPPSKANARGWTLPQASARRDEEAPVIESRGTAERWAELPEAVQQDPTERWLERMREVEHLARLEREQRGVLWIA